MAFNITVPNHTKKRDSKLFGLVHNQQVPLGMSPTLAHPVKGYYGNDQRIGRGNYVLFANNSFKK